MSRCLPVLVSRSLACLLALGCRATPNYDGEPLRCDDECPAGLRCLDGLCIVNSPPEVTPFGARQVVIEAPFEVVAEVSDRDGDSVTLTWTQTEGPNTVLGEPEVSATLALSFDALGLYVFELAAEDGFGPAQTETLAVNVVNHAPVVQAVPDTFAEVGDDIVVDLQVSDEDGHLASVVWTQVLGPPMFAEPQSGLQIAFTATALGLHQFEVVADDGYSASAALSVRVVVEPVPGSVYVTSAGADISGCGTFDAPCASVGGALAQNTGTPTVLVAAADRPYEECLDVGAGVVVRGAFDPVSWIPDPALREATTLRCGDPLGHHVAGDGAVIETLRLSSAVVGGVERAITARLDGGASQLVDVDLSGAPCSEGCTPVVVLVSGASPTLLDVEIHAEVSGFDSVASFIGLQAFESDVTLTSSALARTPDDDARGGVTLDALADQTAVAVFAVNSDLVLERMAVRGGLGEHLVGISALGGTVAVVDSVLALIAFGTTTVTGVSVAPCEPGVEGCACPAEVVGCVEPVGPAVDPQIAITGSLVRLVGSSGSSGLVPCSGVAVNLTGDSPNFAITDSDLELRDAFSFAAGVLGLFTPDAAAGALGAVLEGSRVSLGEGRSTALCEAITPGVEGLVSGNLAVTLVGGRDVAVLDNEIDVAAHEFASSGLSVGGAPGTQIIGNTVRVGGVGQQLGVLGLGATLGPPGGAVPGTFARNLVWLDAGMAEGVGMTVIDQFSGSAAPAAWEIVNNVISAGDALYGMGLVLILRSADPDWPAVHHNTIYGGGESGSGLTARAITSALADEAGDAVVAGRLFHNLIDAGDAQGRRFLFDNHGGVSELSANVGQFAAPIAGPRPSLVFTTQSSGNDSGVGGAARGVWGVLLEGSGEILQVEDLDSGLSESAYLPTWGAPSASFAGPAHGIPVVGVLLNDGSVGLATAEGTRVDPVVRYQPRASSGAAVAAAGLVLASWNGDALWDLGLLTLDPDGAGGEDGGLWVSLGAATVGYSSAQLGVALTDPRFVDVETSGQIVYVLGGSQSGDPVITVVRPPAIGGGTSELVLSSWFTPTPVLDLVESFHVVAFAEDGNLDGADFVIVEAGTPHVLMQGGGGASLPAQGAFDAASPPCAGGRVTAVAAGAILGPTTPAALLLGCENLGAASLHVYRWVGGDWNAADDVSVSGEIAGIAVELGLATHRILVSHQDGTLAVERFTFNTATATFLAGPTDTAALTVFADVVLRDASGAPLTAWPGTPQQLDLRTWVDLLSCPLAFRDGDKPRDYHLASGANLCVDKVPRSDLAAEPALQALADDFDGVGTRTDPALDVGADER